ncbi:hypothetical protein EMPG_14784 [Blastomyces silverae]|uniref:Uncharacterized protein n=1 Tax=Blastomyces silverae TaxID=2060906 RepID=A0A0H1BFD9_9EURO|nr:hypothetical protein EMPG_14784 [Blastomyces silverae]
MEVLGADFETASAWPRTRLSYLGDELLSAASQASTICARMETQVPLRALPLGWYHARALSTPKNSRNALGSRTVRDIGPISVQARFPVLERARHTSDLMGSENVAGKSQNLKCRPEDSYFRLSLLSSGQNTRANRRL